MIKILWVLTGINTAALFFFIAAYFVLNNGKNVDGIERGWFTILAGLGLLVILLAALPLRFGHSTCSMVLACFFAALPLAIALGIFVNKQLPSFKKQLTYAETYYREKNKSPLQRL